MVTCECLVFKKIYKEKKKKMYNVSNILNIHMYVCIDICLCV